MAIHVQITYFPENFRRAIEDPTGPIARIADSEAKKLLRSAVTFIGKRYSGHHTAERDKRLAESGQIEKLAGGGVSVVFSLPIDGGKWNLAQLHHEGTKAHLIPRKEEGPDLSNPRNPARTAGGRFYSKKNVMWKPTGSNANPFLLKAARAIGWRPAGSLKRGTAGPFPIFRQRKSSFTV